MRLRSQRKQEGRERKEKEKESKAIFFIYFAGSRGGTQQSVLGLRQVQCTFIWLQVIFLFSFCWGEALSGGGPIGGPDRFTWFGALFQRNWTLPCESRQSALISTVSQMDPSGPVIIMCDMAGIVVAVSVFTLWLCLPYQVCCMSC